MRATVGEDLRLLDVEAVGRRDVAVRIDDHRVPPVVGVDCINSVHLLSLITSHRGTEAPRDTFFSVFSVSRCVVI